MKPLIVDTGASRSCSGNKDDFVPESLRPLTQPFRMDGISGQIVASMNSRMRFETVDDKGDVQVIETE